MTAAALAVPVLREVRLYGALGREFGRVFRLAVATPAEAVQALMAVLPGFERAFLGRDGQAAYHVYVGRGQQRRTIGEAEAGAVLGTKEPIRLVPVIQGAKRQGALQTIIGAVLIVAGVYFNNPGLIQSGAVMVLGGVIQLLSPQRVGKDERSEQLPSYVFDGPVNRTDQGGPVPVAYGRVVIGSTVVSQGISTLELALPTPTPLVNPNLPWYEESGIGGLPGVDREIEVTGD